MNRPSGESALRLDTEKGGERLLSPEVATLHLGIAQTDLTLVIITYLERRTLDYVKEPVISGGYLSLAVQPITDTGVRSIQVSHYPPNPPGGRLSRTEVMSVFRPPESGSFVTLPEDVSVVADHWTNLDDVTDIAVRVDRHIKAPGLYEILLWTQAGVPGSQYFLELPDRGALALDLAQRSFVPPEVPAIGALREFALSLINEDRRKHGAPPVRLGSNAAAQRHAEDALTHGYLVGHWTVDGRKPYMLYRQAGGVGTVSENAAGAGPGAGQCHQPRRVCGRIDLEGKISELQWAMMYDDAHADWGHRDTIINPDFDTVNIGIAFDDFQVAFYQHFEYVGVTYQVPPSIEDRTLRLRVQPLNAHRV